MWSVAVYDLGLTTEQFWALTPAQFTTLVDRKEADDKRQDIRTGMIVCTMINIMNGKKGKKVGPLEVMGYDKEDGGNDTPKVDQSSAEIALRFRVMAATSKRQASKGKKNGR